jgi:hypothetical protein
MLWRGRPALHGMPVGKVAVQEERHPSPLARRESHGEHREREVSLAHAHTHQRGAETHAKTKKENSEDEKGRLAVTELQR